MNIVILIGNGFDIAQGANTRYKDFYQKFKTVTPINDVEERMIKEINEDVDTWADLEKRLGEFTESVADTKQFHDFYYHLVDELKKYLADEASKHAVKSKEKFSDDLWEPDKYLNAAERKRFGDFLQGYAREAFKMTVISFNYTTLFEDSQDYNGSSISFKPRFPTSSSFTIDKIHKIHGGLNGTPLLGVNDVSQIKNKAMSGDVDVLDFLVKPQANAVIGSLVDEECMTAIYEAHLIILHGLSLGNTDKIWWQKIGERLQADVNPRALYFYFTTENVTATHHTEIGRIKREAQKRLMDACDISEDARQLISERIYVSVNSQFLVQKVKDGK